ncbi:uncharacterized protein EV420DRAFT_1532316, partial [Desarmillaria tabescens]
CGVSVEFLTDAIFLTLLILCSSALGAIYERFEDLPTQNFDFIIIGGGAAGNVLANRLTENSHVSVLVLEAGGSSVLLYMLRLLMLTLL